MNCFDSLGQSRRQFVQSAAAAALGFSLTIGAADTGENVFGPKPGYSPQIGTLVSEMVWMREAVLRTVKGMNREQLEFLLDSKANRIGALLLHLAATERLYQLNTFDKVPPKEIGDHPGFREWGLAMNLGEPPVNRSKGTIWTTI
jgi:hypothetical protein